MNVKLCILILFFYCSVFASEQSDLYFNAATEKYLQGDYKKALENIELLLANEPENQRAKKFGEKIVIEAATNLNLLRKYQEAMLIIEKGKKISPENENILEIERITKEILSPKEKSKSEIPLSVPLSVTPLKEEVSSIKIVIDKHKTPAAKKEAEPVLKTTPVRVRPEEVKPQSVVKEKEDGFLMLISVVFFTVILVLMVVFWVILNRLKKQFEVQKKIIEDNFEATNAALKNEIEGLKRNSFSTPEITRPIIKKEVMKFAIKKDEEHLKEFVDQTKSIKEDVFIESHELERIRERIAIKVMGLNEISQGAAIRFLRELISSDDPIVRANAPCALAAISSTEAIDILIDMSNDDDEKVKREVLKHLKSISIKLQSGSIKLPDDYKNKIKEAIKLQIEEGDWIF
ncbi:MAG: HEAT repeat domain-containing protein [Elusimicrobiota bacterium]